MLPATTPPAAAVVQGTDNEQADCVQQAGIWALSVSNNFIGNRCVCTKHSAWGANAGAVCTQDFTAQHDCCLSMNSSSCPAREQHILHTDLFVDIKTSADALETSRT